MDENHAPAPTAGFYGASGVEHYTSPHRRDAVKGEWEEPVTLAFFRRALARSAAWTDHPQVLDVGCGIGDGLDHLERLRPAQDWRYRGLDTDDDMIDAARGEHAATSSATFAVGDVRTHDWTRPVDVVHSCGVPWSHLTADELSGTVAAFAAGLRERRGRAVLVLDVLGRYSAEWPDRWDSTRWEYVMSFFAGEGDPPTAPMTTWAGHALERAVREAASGEGCRVDGLERWDRALGVGRHADSGQHPSRTAGLRGAVNRLAVGQEVDPAELLIPTETAVGMDADAARDWARHVTGWNALVGTALGEPGHVDAPAIPEDEHAAGLLRSWAAERELDGTAAESPAEHERRVAAGEPTPRLRPRRLFEHLRAHEWRGQRGVGVGHTLMLCCVLDGRPPR